MIRLAQRTLDELAMQPPVSHEIVASMRDIAEIAEGDIPWAGCLVPGPAGLRMTLRRRDPAGKKRFTAFHEVKHTYMPGFTAVAQYRCDPATPPDETPKRDVGIETLCDLGAAELLFPRATFKADIAGNSATVQLVEDLADRYDASLEATARRLVSLRAEPTMLLILEPACKPSQPDAEPALRVQSVKSNDRQRLYLPKHKSVSDDSPFGRALGGESVDEITSLQNVATSKSTRVRITAGHYPYTGSRGERHMRVLALITAVGSGHGR
ncbi:ImmA/IrrE family metallo-endopeptidase [Winogradskya humida]|uniref:ImmA/IrrE family metallo-endopeptidase n=1 Tax=Winogradskya humida TaxID=113566 RepID=UPI001941C9EC|nr:ImmA/IrrE family metallo-endopeptidase [Actinoplanes humidus]